MSMLTRCPECSTAFRITTDQLVSRQGKVRCGRCQHVFSALSSLVHTRDNNAHPPSDPVAPLDARGKSLADTATGVPALDSSSRFLGPGNEGSSTLAANSRLMPLESLSLPPLEAAGPSSISITEESEADDAAPPVARPLKELARAQEKEEEEQAQGHRRVAWLSLLGVLLALAALAGQGAYFYRDQLALWQPETKPYLVEMCARLGCQIKTPLDPQAISIETSSLEADPADRNLLQLTALLRNRSVLAQNLPYLELTLLDAQDAPQARRVIRPEEYGQRGANGAKPAAAQPGAPQLGADSEYQVRISIDASQLKANGYRLYAFYP
jgi:predicted Zn finger-like uncharacterized protein